MIPSRLHVFPPSPNSRKVIMLNAHLGLNLPLTMVDLQSGGQKDPAFLTLNPNGKVPVLELDDGSTLWESNAILNLLAPAGSPLSPAALQPEIQRWQFWEACHWTPACAPFILRHLFGDESFDLDAAAATFHRFAKVLDDHLATRDWLVGDAFSVADIAVAAICYLRAPCHYPLDGYTHIAAWLARVEALPAWKAADPVAEPA